jgi:hypothetical protein
MPAFNCSSSKSAGIEEIKQLKARYFRCMDTKDWDGYAVELVVELHLLLPSDSCARRFKGGRRVTALSTLKLTGLPRCS